MKTVFLHITTTPGSLRLTISITKGELLYTKNNIIKGEYINAADTDLRKLCVSSYTQICSKRKRKVHMILYQLFNELHFNNHLLCVQSFLYVLLSRLFCAAVLHTKNISYGCEKRVGDCEDQFFKRETRNC